MRKNNYKKINTGVSVIIYKDRYRIWVQELENMVDVLS